MLDRRRVHRTDEPGSDRTAPEGNIERRNKGKEESDARREKRRPIQAGQRDGSAAAALSCLPVGLFVLGVRLASAPEREARG